MQGLLESIFYSIGQWWSNRTPSKSKEKKPGTPHNENKTKKWVGLGLLAVSLATCSTMRKNKSADINFTDLNKIGIGVLKSRNIKNKFGPPDKIKNLNTQPEWKKYPHNIKEWCYKPRPLRTWCLTFVNDVLQAYDIPIKADNKFSDVPTFLKAFNMDWKLSFKPIRNPHADEKECDLRSEKNGWSVWVYHRGIIFISRWNPKYPMLAPMDPADTAPPAGDPNAPPVFPSHCDWLEELLTHNPL